MSDTRAWWEAYNAYLASPEWAEFRKYALRFHGERCNHCLRRKSQLGRDEWLEIDHLTYIRVGQELLEDVQVLCNTCHRRKTAKNRFWRLVKRTLGV